MIALSTELSSLDQAPGQDGGMVDNSPHNSPLKAGPIWDTGLWCNPPHHWGETPYTRVVLKDMERVKNTYRSIGNFFLISNLGEILSGFLLSGTKVANSHCRLK